MFSFPVGCEVSGQATPSQRPFLEYEIVGGRDSKSKRHPITSPAPNVSP